MKICVLEEIDLFVRRDSLTSTSLEITMVVDLTLSSAGITFSNLPRANLHQFTN